MALVGPVDDSTSSRGEERGQRERLVNLQGEFLNPVVARRMRAKNNPYRRVWSEIVAMMSDANERLT